MNRIIKTRFRTLAIMLCTLTPLTVFVNGDTVVLGDGDTLTGTVQDFEQGHVTLRSPLADNPLEIKTASVSKITFSAQTSDNPNHQERLTLANNDILPCKVTSMDGKHVNISTWYAGDFNIPRTHVRSLQFGLSENTTIFTGNADPSLWTKQSGTWSFSGTSYTSSQSSSLVQKLPLPENVRFIFDLKWDKTPNFVFRFCAENDAVTTKQNTYEFFFNSAGMQIRRNPDKNQQSAVIANIPSIKPHTLANKSVNISLHVNRKQSLVSLYINSELVDTWLDPFNAPKGNFIIFNNRGTDRSSCTISNISVTTLNHSTRPRYRNEINAISDTDVLVDSEGEKYSGSITSISDSGSDKRIIVFNSKHSSKPLHIPDHRVSTLLLSKPDHTTKFPKPAILANLTNGGHITLQNPKLTNGNLTSIHPILGSFTLSPTSLDHITMSEAAPDTN